MLYPRIIVSKFHENTSTYVDTVTLSSFKNLNQRSLTPRWPLTPSLLSSHVWLYPRIIVSKCHENTSKYVDTVTLFFFKNLNQRLLTPNDLWFHICWGNMCDSTQESSCPSPMGIHQCMWIQWSILQNLTKITTYYIHTMYILYTEWAITLSLLNKVQARQKQVPAENMQRSMVLILVSLEREDP